MNSERNKADANEGKIVLIGKRKIPTNPIINSDKNRRKIRQTVKDKHRISDKNHKKYRQTQLKIPTKKAKYADKNYK